MAAEPPALTVATWNIRAAIGPGEPFPPAWWRHTSAERLESIARQIVDLDADVVGLQEVAVVNVDGVLIDQPHELARLTGYAVRYAAAGHFPVVQPEDGRTAGSTLWGNAVLTRLPIVGEWAAGLPMGEDDELVEPEDAVHPIDPAAHPLAGVRYADAPTGTREPRALLRATVQAEAGRVHVLTTHFTYVGRGQRERQAASSAQAVAALDGAAVLLGDFNAPIHAPELAPLTAELADAFGEVGVDAGSDERLSCGPMAIDHVLLRGAAATDCRVVRDAGDRSDHYPVVARLAAAPPLSPEAAREVAPPSR